MGVSDRLRDMVERKGYSIRAFHRAMQKRDVRGSSYPNVHRYLKGELEPSAEFLTEAADELGVSLLYLLKGEGAASPRDAAAQHIVDEGAKKTEAFVRETFVEPRLRGLQETLPDFPAFGRYARAAVEELLVRREVHSLTWEEPSGPKWVPAEDTAENEEQKARQVGEAIMAPLEALGIPVDSIPKGRREMYVAGICNTLISAMRYPGDRYQPQTTEED